jgi:cell wall-associated NlpC family hydrolase
MSVNQSGTFVYSPDISVTIDGINGVMDVSADVMNFTVERQINAVSSFNCQINNPGRQYNFGMPKQISTMDRITVFLKRTNWVQVFTGYITYAPIETLVPTPISITANCTLRILQTTYWDDTLIQYQSLLLNFMDNAAQSSQQTLMDGGIGQAIVNMLYGVCGWNPKNIHIQGIPENFVNFAATAYTNLIVGQNLDQNIVQELANILSIRGVTAGGSTSTGPSASTLINTDAPDGGATTKFTASQARAFITTPIAGGKQNFPGPNTMNPVNVDLISEDIYYCSAPWSYLQYAVTDSVPANKKQEYQSKQDAAKTWLMTNPATGGSDGRLLLLNNQSQNRAVLVRTTSIPQKPDVADKSYAVYDPGVDYLQLHPGVIAYLQGNVDDPTKWNSTKDPGPVRFTHSWPDPNKLQQTSAGIFTASSTDVSSAASTVGQGTTTANDGLVFQKALNKLIYVLIGQLGDNYSEAASGPTYRMTPATAYGAHNGYFDCSGLAYWAYQQLGVNLGTGSDTGGECGPRDGSKPEIYGMWFDPSQQPPAGSLMFWGTPGDTGRPEHVIILVGEFGKEPPAGIGYDGVAANPNIGYVIGSSHTGLGPNAAQIPWDQIANSSTTYGGKGFQYVGARWPMSTVQSFTGAQLKQILSTSYDRNVTTSTSTNTKTTNTTSDPNNVNQRAMINLAGSYNTIFQMPQYDLRATAMLGTPRAFLLDNPVMKDLTQIMQAGLRSYMSAPNGDFVAWFPDYYGIYGTDPVLDISPVEIIDFQIYHDDNQLATHVGVVGDTNGIGQQVSNVDYITTNGIVSIQDATTMQMLFGKQVVNQKVYQQDSLDAYNFLNKYGMRPFVQEQNMIHSHSLEYMYALYQFMQQWTQQYVSNVTFTFMPELYPGMRVSMTVTDETNQPHTYMFYATTVTHTGDRAGGFTTQATLTAPMKDGNIMSYGLGLAQ